MYTLMLGVELLSCTFMLFVDPNKYILVLRLGRV
jgi:hypothetical protein